VTDGGWRVFGLGELARSLSTAEDDEARLRIAVEQATRLLPGCDHASVTTLHRGRLSTGRSSSETGSRLDRMQYDADEGPCLDALRDHVVVDCADLRAEDRWPSWRPQALAETAVRATLSVPLRTDGVTTFGSLNLYAERPGTFGADQRDTAQVLADSVAAAVSAGREIDQLSTALQSRTAIGQAEGILMERLGIDADQAFAYLRRVSQAQNRKLVQVAADIVRTRQLPDLPD
jgi:GAF domain-containing protein